MTRILSIIQKFKTLVIEQRFNHIKLAVDLIRGLVEKQEDRKSTYVSFNGGKDATVVLYLTAFAYHQLKIPFTQLKVLYFEEPNPFEEVEQFRRQTKEMLGFKEIKTTRNFIEALTGLKTEYKIDNIIMGSRKTDPYCENLDIFSQSDVKKGYPDFMRVNPILNWSYETVWNFIHSFEIPYCSLYEQGYTYLGNKRNTTKNTQLQKEDGQYYPAWVAKQQNECKSRCNK